MLAILIAVSGWWAYGLLNNVNKVFHSNVIADAHALITPTDPLNGEAQGRVNVLLAGDSDDRTDGGGGGDLTDSVMVVSIDTVHHTGFMLTIPRDTWVQLPPNGGPLAGTDQKINAANTLTNFSAPGFPNGGMGALEYVITKDFGIPIDYYSLINYQAFEDAVNAVGGITINIQSSDPRGIYDASPMSPGSDQPLIKLPNGPVTLDGVTALNLARARGDAYGSYGLAQGDFDRTEHQRQMLVALEQKAMTAGVISNPIRVSQLFDTLGQNVQTDLTISNALRFAQLAKGISATSLQSLALSDSGSNPLLTPYRTPSGEDALAPKAGIDNYTQIQQYYAQLTSSSPVVQEAPTVVVLNGSGNASLGKQEASALQAKGFTVVSTENAESNYASSMVVDLTNGQKPASRQVLQQLLGANTETVTSTTGSTEAVEASNYSADFVVILGGDLST